MQLRDRKYIKNTGNFPKYYGGLDGYSFFGTQRLTAPNTNNLYGGYYMPENPYQTSQFFNKPNPSYNDYLIAKNGGDPNVAGKGLFQYKTPSLAQTREQQQTTPNPTGAIGSAGLGFVGSIAEIAATNAKGAINEFTYQPIKSNEIVSNQRTNNNSIGGVAFNTIDTKIDTDLLLDHWSDKNVAMDIFSGNIGGAIGKIFGGGRNRQLELIRKASRDIEVNNRLAIDNAMTQWMQNNQALQQSNNGVKEHAYDGRDAKLYTLGGKMKNVNTAYGKWFMPQNAWTNKGEQIVDTLTYDSYKVKSGRNDTAPTFLRGRDAVLTASKEPELLNPETGNSFAEDWPVYKAAGKPQRLLDLQEFVHWRNNMNNKTRKYYGGRTAFSDYYGNDYSVDPSYYLNGFPYTPKKLSLDNDLKRVDKGRIPEIKPWEILASRLPGLFSSIGGFINTRKQPTSRINSYYPNTYADMALPKLAGLRINNIPVLQDIDSKLNAYMRQLASQYSLTAGQKQLYHMAAIDRAQRAKANAIYDAQIQNNKYISDWASAAINVGDRRATTKASTKQYDTRYADEAIAARNKVANSFLTDANNQSGAFTRDLINSRILNAMLNRYQA